MKTFNTSYLPDFGNVYFDTLMRSTLDNADMAVDHTQRDSEVTHMIDQYQTRSLETINCTNLRGLVDSIEDQELQQILNGQLDAIAKHSKFNAEFAVKMKNFKAHDKGKRMAYAQGLLDEGKENNAYPSANSLNIVLENCATFAKAQEKLQEIEGRGASLNVKGLDILIGLAKTKEEADTIFLEQYQATGVNAFIMNKMIKFCNGIDEARDMVQYYFAVPGLQLNHGSMLSLISCAKNAEEADHVIDSMVAELGYSKYMLNTRLKHDDNIVDMEATVKRIEEDSYKAGQGVLADSDTFAYMTKKLIDAGDLNLAQFYLNRTEKHRAKENKKPNRFMAYLKKTLAGQPKPEQPEKTASTDKI